MFVSVQMSAIEVPEGFTALFNGKNLSGWKAKAGGWRVENGTLARRKGAGYIWTEEVYGDFILDLEVKVSPRCNSGTRIPGTNRADSSLPSCGNGLPPVFAQCLRTAHIGQALSGGA